VLALKKLQALGKVITDSPLRLILDTGRHAHLSVGVATATVTETLAC
jgi:hypothetical protein